MTAAANRALHPSSWPRVIGGLGVLVASLGFQALATAAASPQDCSTATSAFERLLDGSFEVERTFRMSVNGNLKRREVVTLTSSGGEFEIEVLEDEVLSKSMVFEDGGKDFMLAFEFDCERLRVTRGGNFALISEDGLEVAEFRMDEKARALVPVSWRLDTTERFLFKKFVIEGRAEYTAFSWRTSPGE